MKGTVENFFDGSQVRNSQMIAHTVKANRPPAIPYNPHMPTKQAYLAVHQAAELTKQVNAHKIKEIEEIKKARAKRIEQAKVANNPDSC
jgi:hypothetical protein